MGIVEQVRGAVTQVRKIAGPLRAHVKHQKLLGRTATGIVLDTPGVPLLALVEDIGETIVTIDGIDTMMSTKLTFMEPLVVTAEDHFVLPNGSVETVMKHESLLDPQGLPYMTEVWLGNLTGRR